MHKRKHVLIISSLFLPHLGGVEQYTHSIASALGTDHKVTVFCLNTENQPAEADFDDFSVQYLPCYPAFQGRLPIPKISALRSLASYCAAHPIDFAVIQNRLYPLNLGAASRFKKKKIPHILIEHGTGHIDYGSRGINLLWKVYEHAITLGFRRFTQAYYGVSRASLEWLNHFGIRGQGILHNGISPQNFRGIEPFNRGKFSVPPEAFIIAFAGRIIREKGVPVLLQAFAEYQPENVHLVIAGSGDMDLVQPWQSDPAIHFTGQLTHPELLSLLSECSLFCLPTMYPEGLPTVILEAGFFGKPVITTNAGGISDVIRDQETGWFVTPGDTENLRRAIQSLMENAAERERLGGNLQKLVQSEFTWEKILLKLKKIMDSMCGAAL